MLFLDWILVYSQPQPTSAEDPFATMDTELGRPEAGTLQAPKKTTKSKSLGWVDAWQTGENPNNTIRILVLVPSSKTIGMRDHFVGGWKTSVSPLIKTTPHGQCGLTKTRYHKKEGRQTRGLPETCWETKKGSIAKITVPFEVKSILLQP